MSELQLGLLAIGAIVVVAVLAYNKWQERLYRRRAEAGFRSRYHDVLAQDDSGESASAESSPETGARRVEPAMGGSQAGRTPVAAEGGLSEALDFIVPVEAADEIAGAAILDATAALGGFSRPVRWEGFNDAKAQWESLRPGERYYLMRAGLQLVDRRGAATGDELSAFGAGVQEAAAAAAALAVVPDPAAALERAAELDRFCSEVDIRIALHVVSTGTAFTGTKVRALAEAAGMALDERDGRFHRADDAGRMMFTLGNLDAEPFRADAIKSLTTRGLTLELDVPRAPRGAFEALRECARQLAQTLEASIVDDNRQPLGASAFDAIRAQLQAIHRTMEARGIAPGGAAALRLFS